MDLPRSDLGRVKRPGGPPDTVEISLTLALNHGDLLDRIM